MATELVQKFSECFWFWHPEAKVRYEDDARLVVEHFAGKRGLKNSTRPCSVGLFKRAKKQVLGAVYFPRWLRAISMALLEIWIRPSSGWFSSRIKKIAPETEMAETINAAVAVGLKGAKSPKLKKRRASQQITTASRVRESELRDWVKISHRASPISEEMLSAWDLSARWTSF